jgi:hypothetical protein
VVLAAGVAALLTWQRREATDLREPIAREQARLREREQLAEDNRRLAAAQPSDAEMESLVNRLTQSEQLKAQLAVLRIREEAAAKVAALPTATEARLSLATGPVPADRWRNAGQATAEAAFETALWAAANGDLDALAGVLVFDSAARKEADALFARLPPGARAEMATPEKMIAVLTAMDVPLGQAAITRQQAGSDATTITARLSDATGRTSVALFSLKSDGGRWQLRVPASAVRKYAATWDQK